MRKKRWEVKISHCYSEANKVVDILANKGVDDMLDVTVY